MVNPEKLFGNMFTDKAITALRLYAFANDLLNRLIAASTNSNNQPLIDLLTPAVANLRAELSEIDTSLGLQKGKTASVEQLVEDFKSTMSKLEGVIAYNLGGAGTPGYIEFYPKGVSEYSGANKTEMPLLVSRVKAATARYADKLPAAIAGQLQEFESTWKKLRDEQVQQKGNLSDNRTGRQEARTALELALLTAIHTIALRFPGNAEAYMALFNFGLLGAQRQKQKAPVQPTAGIPS